MKTQFLKCVLLLLFPLCVCVMLSAQETQPVGNVARVKLINASTKRIIANASVEVRSNNGIRCRRSQCPTNRQSWRGASDADGVLRIPSHIIQHSTGLTVAGYQATDFNKTAAKIADGTLIIELSPDTSTAPQGMTSDVPPPSLPAGKGAWLVRIDVNHYGRDEMESRSWVLTSGSDIAAGNIIAAKMENTVAGSMGRETFPCRAKLSAENLRRMETVVAAVRPSAWRFKYGKPEVGFRGLTLKQREADGKIHTYIVTLHQEAGDQPEDLRALHAATQAVAKQAFAEQNCGSSPLL